MANPESHNLERAVKEIAPDKASTLAAKYAAVMDSINNGLIQADPELATDSKNHLEQLASEVIDSTMVSDESRAQDRKFMVEVLEAELDNVSKALNIGFDNIDVRDVIEDFSGFDAFFGQLHIEFPEDVYKTAYLNASALGKIDPGLLNDEFDKLWILAIDSDFYKSFLYENQNQLLTAVGQLCNGDSASAVETVRGLYAEMKKLTDPEVFRNKTGLNLPDENVQILMRSLADNRITTDKVYAYISKIKKANPDTFAKIDLPPMEMTIFLVGLVLNFKNGAKEFVRQKLEVEAVASKLEAKYSKELATYSSKLGKKVRDLQDYQSKNPDKLKDAYVLRAERNIAVIQTNIKLTQFEQFRVKVQRYLALTLAEKSSKATNFDVSSKEIFAKLSVDGLRKVAAKYGIDLPSDFGLLEKLSLDYQLAKTDSSFAEELDDLSPDDKSLYEQFYADFVAGKLDTGAKKDVVLYRIYEESQSLASLSNDNETIIDRDRVGIYDLIDRYGSISDVPLEERESIRQRIATYFKILRQGQIIAGRLLGTYISAELLDPKQTVGKDKRTLQSEIADLRGSMTEIAGSMEDMAQFLGIKDFKTPAEEAVATSPLHSPILAREVKPFNDRYVVSAEKVSDSSNNLGFALAQLQKYGENPEHFEERAIPPTRLFNDSLRAFDKLEVDISAARDSVNAVFGELLKYRDALNANKVDVVKKYPSLKPSLLQVINASILQANFLLHDDNSPLGNKNLLGLQKAHAELKVSYDNYLHEKFYQVVATALIIAAAVAGGVLAAGLLAKVGGGLLLTSAGVAAGGTLGSRAGMAATNALNWTEFSTHDMWAPENLGRDFLISWGFSLAAVGAARGALTGLSKGASSTNLWLSNASKGTLGRLEFLQRAVAPAKWFGVGEGQVSKEVLKKFGVKFTGEYGEEVAETTLETVHPVVGFVASMINCSDGINVELSQVGIDTKKVNAGIEGNSIVYKTATAQEFVSNMEEYFTARGARSFNAEIAADGVVKVSVEDANGRMASLEVKPGNVDLDPSVEVRRVEGLRFDQNTGNYSVNEVSDVMPVMSELSAKGFVLQKIDGGVRATKGTLSLTIEIDPAVEAEVVTNLGQMMSDMNDIARMAEQEPSPSLAANLRLKLASLTLTLLTLAPQAARAGVRETIVEFGQDTVGSLIASVLDVTLSIADYALPIYGLYRIVIKKGSFGGFPAFWKQAKASGDLRPKLETILRRYETRAGNEVGDRAAREIGGQLRATIIESILDLKRSLNLVDLTDKFWTGANRALLEPLVLNLELSTNTIFDMLEGKRPFDQRIFDAEVGKVRGIIPQLISTDVKDVKLLSKLSTWIWALILYILYRQLRGTVLTGDRITSWLKISNKGSSGGGGGYSPAPSGAPSGASSGAPSGVPDDGEFGAPPSGAPSGAPSVPGPISEGSDFENTLPSNLKGKDFYQEADGTIRRKGKPGTYEINPDNSVIYTQPGGKKLRLSPNGNVDANWPEYTGPVGQSGTPAQPTPAPSPAPNTPSNDRLPSVEDPDI